jgi:hypothetical protein
LPGALHDRVQQRQAILATLAVDEVHEDEAVVHDDPAERDRPDRREDRERVAHDPVPEDRADEAVRDRAHDDEGLAVGAEQHRDDAVDEQQRDREEDRQRPEGLPRVLLAALEGDGDAGESSTDVRERRGQLGRDVAHVQLRLVDLGLHGHRALSVDAAERGVAARRLERRHLLEGHAMARARRDPEPAEVAEALARSLRKEHPDRHLLALGLQVLRLESEERVPELQRDVPRGEPEGARRLAEPHPRLELALLEVVLDLVDAVVGAHERADVRDRALHRDEVLAPDPDLEVGPAGPAAARGDDEPVRARGSGGRLPQVRHDLAGLAEPGPLALVGRVELERHLAHGRRVGRRDLAPVPERGPHDREDTLDLGQTERGRSIIPTTSIVRSSGVPAAISRSMTTVSASASWRRTNSTMPPAMSPATAKESPAAAVIEA